MYRDISFMQYMRAHGNTPGPTQRPYLTGMIGGLAASVPSMLLLHYTGASRSIARNFGVETWMVLLVDVLIFILAGIVYAAVFKRAANDHDGGWLFGISYGFLLWVLGPVTLWQVITGRPLAVGLAAMGLFGAQVLYGLVLGLVFPLIHSLVQSRLNREAANWEYHTPEGPATKTRGA